MTDHIIHSTDGQTYDLTTNRIPFGLLPEDVQEAMKAWQHGWEFFDAGGKWRPWNPTWWSSSRTNRAIFAPKVTEHMLYWHGGYYATDFRAVHDTHRITLRDDGKGNLTATVEKL